MSETQAADPAAFPPLDTPKPVADGLWIVDGAPIHLAGLALPVRMTVIRIGQDLLLHSPTRHSPALAQRLAALGNIRHLVAPSFAHWIYVPSWQAAHQEATTWTAPGLAARRQVRRSGLRIDRELTDSPPPEWAGTIDQLVIPGGLGFREMAFFHRPSRTALLTDLVQNFPPEKLPPRIRPLARAIGIVEPDGRTPVYLRALVHLRHRDAAQAARRVVDWTPERVIFAHGRWFDREGTYALRRSLRWLIG